MDELDVWRAADQMIKLHGKDAAVKAALRADALLDLGDVEGFHTWKRVVIAINRLESDGRREDEAVN
jgi:hypothetical protein